MHHAANAASCAASGERRHQFDIATFYTFAGGRIVKIREIMDTFDLIQQVLERDLVALLTDSRAGKTWGADA